jgi:integrase
MNDVAAIRFKYVHRNASRHGNVRYYYREPGKPLVRLPDDPTSEAFVAAYHKARAGEEADRPKPRHRIRDGSLRALLTAYLGSVEFAELSPATQAQRRRVVDSICHEPLRPGAAELFADVPLPAFKAKHVRVLRDRKADAPAAANHRLKLLRQVFGWGCEHEWVSHNPVTDVKALRSKSDGYHTWTVEEVERYLEIHPAGSKARLALGLLLFMGIRISDLALIGPQHRRGDVHVFRPYKGRERSPKELHLPVLPGLERILSTSKTGHMAYLVTEYGKPFSTKGLGQRFRKWCDAAELPHCSAHGLRKAGATIAAENGASDEDLKALFGWSNAREANTYTRKARQKIIARRAISMIDFGAGVSDMIEGADRCIIALDK